MRKTGFRLLAAAAAFMLAAVLAPCAMALELTGSGAAEGDPVNVRIDSIQRSIRSTHVGSYGMLPVYGKDVEDGVYSIEVDSSSPYFKIHDAQLTVKGDDMECRFAINSLSYLYVYPGTVIEAEKAPESEWIGFEEEDGRTVFTVPVSALDTRVKCSAYSKARKMWYDRDLVFRASSLPEEAVLVDLPDYEAIEEALKAYDVGDAAGGSAEAADNHAQPEAVDADRIDGEYSIEVNMTGGSGRASISSPTLMTVKGGKAYATLIWSSTYYDYMLIDGARYNNLTTDGGNSTFEIPITVMDEPMTVIGDTTAMGDPIEIEYTLLFYSDTIGSKDSIPQEAAKQVLIISGIVIAAGAVLNHLIKRRFGG